MELRDYVRDKRRWLLPLALAPLLAAAVTTVILLRQPVESTAQVQLVTPPAASDSDSAIGLYVAKLDEGLHVDDVVRQLADQTGVGAPAIRQGLSVSRVGASNQIRVTFTGTSGKREAAQVADAAARTGVVYVARQAGSAVEQQLNTARQVLADAQNALYAFQDQSGTMDPSAAYQVGTGSLRTARAELASAQAMGDTARAARAQAQVAALEAQQDSLVPLVRQYTPLQAAVAAANNKVNDAQAAVTDYQARLAAAQSGAQIVQSSASDEPRHSGVREGAGLAAVIAFLAVLGLSLLPDLLRRQRARPMSALGDHHERGATRDEPQRRPLATSQSQHGLVVAVPNDRPVGGDGLGRSDP